MTDRVEDAVAWALLACALFVVAVGVVTGMAVYAATVERARVEAAERTPTTAVLVQDVPTVPVTNPTGGRMPVTATWRDADGAVRTGVIEAGVGLAAGAEVPRGSTRPGPCTGAGVAGRRAVGRAPRLRRGRRGGRRRARRALVGGAPRDGARNTDIWEQEWAQVGPAWRRDDDAR